MKADPTPTADPPKPAPAPKPKGGAPKGSANHTTHGVRGYLVTGRLPKSASYVRKQLSQLRRQLESAVEQSHGEVSLYHAAVVQSTVRHEARATLLNRYLATEKNLTLADRMALLAQIGAATDSRDKCLKLLGLDIVKGADPWAALDAMNRAEATAAANGHANGEGGDHADR